MDEKTKIHLIGIGLIILIFAIVSATADPLANPQKQIVAYVSAYGIIALLCVLFVTSIPVLFRIWNTPFTAALLRNRRWIGIYAFIFALIHVFIASHFFFVWNLEKIFANQFRVLGGVALLILAAMAATSNDLSVRLLKKNWKRLHLLVYVAILLIIIHGFNIGQIFLKNDTGKAVVISIAVMFVLGKLIYQYPIRGIFKPKQS